MPPAVAVHIMGTGGAVLVLLMLFMAVTSTGSAEQIAVSSLFAYDVYKEYINKDATGKDVRPPFTSHGTSRMPECCEMLNPAVQPHVQALTVQRHDTPYASISGTGVLPFVD